MPSSSMTPSSRATMVSELRLRRRYVAIVILYLAGGAVTLSLLSVCKLSSEGTDTILHEKLFNVSSNFPVVTSTYLQMMERSSEMGSFSSSCAHWYIWRNQFLSRIFRSNSSHGIYLSRREALGAQKEYSSSLAINFCNLCRGVSYLWTSIATTCCFNLLFRFFFLFFSCFLARANPTRE